MTKEQIIDKIVKDLPIKEMRNKMTNAEWYGWFLECWNEAINYTHCCETSTCDVCFNETSNNKNKGGYRYCNSCEKL